MRKKVLVVGDVILDEYVYGRKMGVSAETPTVVAEYVKTESFVGGAGLVARHLLRLGCEVSLLTVGKTSNLRQRFLDSSDHPDAEEMGRLTCVDIAGKGWDWTEKRRFFVDGYKMVQYDVLNCGYYSPELTDIMMDSYIWFDGWADSVIICDNRHGVMGRALKERIRGRMKYGREVFVDSQVSQRPGNIFDYSGVTAVFMNKKELDSVVDPVIFYDTLESRVLTATQKLGSGVILKLGELGSLSCLDGKNVVDTSAYSVKAVDTCGAGDAFIAAYVARNDLTFANRWAAMSTTYTGTVVPPKEML